MGVYKRGDLVRQKAEKCAIIEETDRCLEHPSAHINRCSRGAWNTRERGQPVKEVSMAILSPVRLCRKCGEKKPPSDFHRDRTRSDGLCPYCKTCVKAYHVANAVAFNRRAQDWQRENKPPKKKPRPTTKPVTPKTQRRDCKGFGGAISLYKRNADVRGFVWALTNKEAIALFSGNCHYCGVGPSSNNWGTRNTPLRSGIDRLDSSRGYAIDNCVTCCGVCNKMKSDMPYADFIAHITKIYTHRKDAHDG
jgi:hypothetical protein